MAKQQPLEKISGADSYLSSTSKPTPRSRSRAHSETEEAPRKHGALIAFSLILLAAIGAYLLGVRHYQEHFLPGVTVGGIDASNLTVAELSKQVKDNIDAYSMHVSGNNADFSITAQDAKLTVDSDAIAQSAHDNTNPYLWPIALWHHEDVSVNVGVSYDQEALDAAVAGKVDEFNQTAQAATDAGSSWSDEKDAFVLVPCVPGGQLDVEPVKQRVSEGISTLQSAVDLEATDLLQPTVKDDNQSLKEAIERLNTIVRLSIPLTLNGKTLITVDKNLIKDWLYLTYGDGSMHAAANSDAIRDWSYANLNDIVNGEDEVHGWEVSSPDVAAALAPKIMNNDNSPLEIPTMTTFERPDESEGHESRGRHIDVNLSSQYARLYDSDGKTVLWRSGIVSGDEAKGHSTPTGDYEINSMEQNVVLKGLKDDVQLKDGEQPKEEDYYNSNVNYWMCFLGNAYGLHDATWRGDYEFGGDTYLYDGSHGCVNLPYDAAAELYSLIHVGDKVHIHY